jgi:2-polyprenyl-3-methyl-5-hydroxy-6-metoxy-1,4-benzoquinol methylase
VPGKPWNRNVHYHDLVLATVPAPCQRALDVGCGAGRLASELAERCGEVIGIDADSPTLARARVLHARPNLTFVDGDVMTHPFAAGSFDVIASIATLHHLPLEPALLRFRDLLRPGGVLVVIGLYRLASPTDYIIGGAATIVSAWFRLMRGTEHVNAPIRDPETSLREIRAAVERVLPGAIVKRKLFYRYSLVWRKPSLPRASRP